MKALKWLLILLIAVPLILFAALAVFLSFADLSKYKSTIEEQAEAATGRKLTIEGDINVSLFPWVKLETGAIQLANAEGFGEQPMVSLDSASAGIKVLPLLSGNIELDVVTVEGLTADLQVNAAGVSNLDDLSGEPIDEPSTEGDSADTSIPPLKLGGLALKNANLRYRDAVSGTDATASDVNLNIGVLDGESDTPVEGSLNVLLQPDNITAVITLDTKIKANLQDMRFNALGLELKAALTGEAIPTGAINLGVGGDLEADLVAQTLDIPKLNFLLGDTTFDGKARLTGLDQTMPSVTFELAGDTLDVDKLLGIEATESTDSTAESAVSEEAADPADDAIELPMETLRTLDIEGQMTLQKMIVSNVEMTDITLQLQAKDGQLSIPKLAASLYEGTIDSNVSLDARKDVPLYRADAAVTGVQVQPLLAAAADFEQLLGSGDIQLNVNTTGTTVSGLTEALNGNFSFNFADGAIDGINLAAQGRKVMRLFGRDVGDEPTGEAAKTDFSALGASAKITNGVIENTDLDMRSPLLRVGGEGTVALPAEMVDYTVNLLLTSSLEGQGGESRDETGGLNIPIKIKGTFTELSEDFVGTVSQSMQDSIKDNLKAQSEEKIAAEKARLKAKADEEKAKIKAKADEEKAKLEAKVAEEREAKEAELKKKLEKEKDRLKDKAADALKKLF